MALLLSGKEGSQILLTIPRLIAFLLTLLIAIDVHECAHAWAANELGDPTARYQGRLSLNPLVHLDPLGTLMMLFSVFYGFGIGWGKPVPVNPVYLRYGPRVGMALVSVAGPLSNLLLATIVAVPIRVAIATGTPLPELLALLLGTMVSVNIGLALFNLLPISPLDGHSVLVGILSTIRARWAYNWTNALERMRLQGPLIFIILIMIDQVLPFSILGLIIGPPFRLLYRLLLGY